MEAQNEFIVYLLELLKPIGPVKAKAIKRKGKELSTSYYKTPYEAMDNTEELYNWAKKAYEAAVRSAKERIRKKVTF